MPLVSIIMPTRNYASYLPYSIGSCLAQSYANLELVIVDDGSTDDTAEVCRQFMKQDKRVKYHRIEHDATLDMPRLYCTGYAFSMGEYCKAMGSDDMLARDCIKLESAYLQANPKIMAVSGRILQIASHKAVALSGKSVYTSTTNVHPRLIMKTSMFPDIALHRRVPMMQFIKSVKNIDKTKIPFYWTAWLWMLRRGGIVYLNAPLYYYFQHVDSTSRKRNQQGINYMYSFIEKYVTAIWKDSMVFHGEKGIHIFRAEGFKPVKEIPCRVILPPKPPPKHVTTRSRVRRR